MKFSVVLFCAIVIVLKVRASSEIEESEEIFREEYCKSVKYSINKDECSSFRCSEDNSKIIAVGCAEARCSGKPVAFKGDRKKPYPDCCMIPICDSE